MLISVTDDPCASAVLALPDSLPGQLNDKYLQATNLRVGNTHIVDCVALAFACSSRSDSSNAAGERDLLSV